MKNNKLDKYRLGNFELKPKHIYAKEKLTLIFNNILKKYGGAKNVDQTRSSLVNQIDSIIKEHETKKTLLTMQSIEPMITKMMEEFESQNNDPNTSLVDILQIVTIMYTVKSRID